MAVLTSRALLLLALCVAACRTETGADAIVAKAEALAAPSAPLRARFAAAAPLAGFETAGATALRSAPHRVLAATLPARSDAPLRVSDSGHPRRRLDVHLERAGHASAERSGDALVYRDAYPDTDVVMFANEQLVEASYLLRSPSAPMQLGWRLDVADGLTARTTALGIELCDPSGDVALRIPPATAFDARGVEVPVRQWLEGGTLHFALQTAPTAWPVLLDPVVEIAVWQRMAGDPLWVSAPGLAYDSVRGRVVMFGGLSFNSVSGDTWEWDGSHWTLMSSTGPGPRQASVMAYDPARQRTVLYGGLGITSMHDTWEWDGTSWELRSGTAPLGSIVLVYAAAMAWDAQGQRLVMFGGTNGSFATYSNGLYSWDGSSWSPITTNTPPSPRLGSGLAYDPSRQVLVLFGGSDAQGERDDTWELAGSTWTQRMPALPRPGARHAAPLVWSGPRGTVVLHAGIGDGGVDSPLDDLWEWNGSTWSQLANPPLGPRRGHQAVFDSARAVDVFVMGRNATGEVGDIWEWDGGTWVDRTPHENPAPRRSAALAYDSARGVTTLFGGASGDGGAIVQRDTWEWDGQTWSQRAGPQPTATLVPAMAFDARRGVQVLSTSAGETWEWDGGIWLQRGASSGAPATALAYDQQRGVTVAFIDGGTLEYDGTSWSLRPVAGTSPSKRIDFGLAADAHGRTWLFGGADASTVYNELWIWDGGSWARVPDSGVPTPRSQGAWTWDTRHDVGVLVGGSNASNVALGDAWLLDPTLGAWIPDAGGTGPAARRRAAATYDGRRGRVVLFGGVGFGSSSLNFNDTWELNLARTGGSDCTDGGQCLSGFCTNGACCDVPQCSGGCGLCNVNGLGTCVSVSAGAPGTPACAPYVCDGLSQLCPSACTGDAGCVAGSSCMGGACSASLPKGADCINDGQCLSGHCVGNLCCLTTCDGGCQTCRQSEGASEDGVCGARPTTTVCRAKTDLCDLQETCDGVSAECPNDLIAGIGVVCRGAVDTCDVPELCTGLGVACPGDQLRDAGTPCVSGMQSCSAPSLCTGSSPLCPATAPAVGDTPCRPTAGLCDRPEVCDGVHLDCPSDELLPAGTRCESGDCAAECSGSAVTCPECPPVSHFSFGCDAAPGAGALGLLGVLRRRRAR